MSRVVTRLAVSKATSGVVTRLAVSPKTALAPQPPLLEILVTSHDATSMRAGVLARNFAPIEPLVHAAASDPAAAVAAAAAALPVEYAVSTPVSTLSDGSKTPALLAPKAMVWAARTVLDRPLLVGP
jgi:hypothetical protein